MDLELFVAAEVIKEERLFGTFNTEDIFTSPASELSDPISVEIEQTHLIKEKVPGESRPNAMGGIIESVFKEAFYPANKEQGASEIKIDNIKLEDNFEITSDLEVPGSDLIRAIREPITSFGLKIADFAVDPDNCAIVSETSSPVTTHPSLNEYDKLLPQVSENLDKISFNNSTLQLNKLYHVMFNEYTDQFKENYILTSGPEQNNTRIEWKLFIPVSAPFVHPGHLLSLDVTKNGNQFFILTHSQGHVNLIVKHVEHLHSFLECIKRGHHLMIKKENLLQIAKCTEIAKTDNQLIPGYHYKIVGKGCIFETEISELGYEGVPKGWTNNKQSILYNMILKGLDNHYALGVQPRIIIMAKLMENDLIKQSIPEQAMNAKVTLMKYVFISKIKEYPNLANYPEMLYQLLRKTLLSLKVVKNGINICHNSMLPSKRTNTKLLLLSHNQLTSIPKQMTPIRVQKTHIPTQINRIIQFQPVLLKPRQSVSGVFQSGTSQKQNTTHEDSMMKIVPQTVISCPFPATMCVKRIHEGTSKLVEHLSFDHFQIMLSNRISKEQEEYRYIFISLSI